MALFRHENRQRSERTRDIYAAYEIAYTVVDFAAALSFVVGSVLFLGGDTQTTATWLFIVGSVCFALKPTLRMMRELRLAAIGDTDNLARRAGLDPGDDE